MDLFGEINSRNMPTHFFWECLHLDHATAVRANVSRQNYSVCPRHWYIDATFSCSRCLKAFCFTAAEQKQWYEELGFYVDSYAKTCGECRRDERKRKALRQTYDRDIESDLQSKDINAKQQLAIIIDELCTCDHDLPMKLHENRATLGRQITRLTTQNDG